MFSNYFFRKSILILIIWFMSFFFMIGKVYAESPGNNVIVIWPYQGVRFFQLVDSQYGLFVADFNQLYGVTGIPLGFLNVMTEQGWIIRNIPVDISSGYPGLSTIFNLGNFTSISSIFAYAKLSTEPIVEFSEELPSNIPKFNVDPLYYNISSGRNRQGAGILNVDDNLSDTNSINFKVDGLIELNWQLDHKNLQQDDDQCGPASVANSLQWLKETQNLDIKGEYDENSIHIKDETMVGRLDDLMDRDPDLPPGKGGVTDEGFINGKLGYIKEENLCDKLKVKHKTSPHYDEARNGDGGGGWIPADDVQINEDCKSFVNKTDVSLVDWIIKELKDDEDVEVAISWDNGGGHWIDLIGGGYILGVPWLAWVHDTMQGEENDNENRGTILEDGGIGFSFIGQGYEIVSGSSSGRIDLATSESLPVKLSEFKSIFNKDNIHLIWLTGTEIKNASFYLWRATKDQYGGYKSTLLGEFSNSKQVNPGPNENCSTKIQGQLEANNSAKLPKSISAIGNSTESTCYSFTDTSNLSDGTYYYLLENISDDGKSTFHCDQIDAVTIGQGPAIDLESAINYCKEVTGSNN